MSSSEKHWTLLANLLWAIHILVVLLVVCGFIAQFFIPQITPWELKLIGIVIVLQFLWFGKCPVTVLENHFRKKADPTYAPSKHGCISETVFNVLHIRVTGIVTTGIGLVILAVTTILYL